MQAYWRRMGPPVHVSVAAYMGLLKDDDGPPRAKGASPASTERVRAVDDVEGFMALFQGAGGARQ